MDQLCVFRLHGLYLPITARRTRDTNGNYINTMRKKRPFLFVRDSHRNITIDARFDQSQGGSPSNKNRPAMINKGHDVALSSDSSIFIVQTA